MSPSSSTDRARYGQPRGQTSRAERPVLNLSHICEPRSAELEYAASNHKKGVLLASSGMDRLN